MYAKDHSFEPGSAAPRSSTNGSSSSDTESVELAALMAELREDSRKILRGLKRAWAIEWGRLGLRAIDTFFRAAFYLCLLGFGLTASIAASLLVVGGLRNALHAWSGAGWAGDLGGGVLVLGFVLMGGLAVRAHLRRDLLRSTKRAVAESMEPSGEPSAEPSPEPSANAVRG